MNRRLTSGLVLGLTLAVSALAVLIVVHIHASVAVEKKPVRFGGDLYSYQTIQQVQGSLQKQGVSWQIYYEHALGYQREHRIFGMRVPVFHHLNHEGQLTLEFLDNRLVRISFEPKDFDGYVKELQTREGVVLRPESRSGMVSAVMDAGLRVWANANPPTNKPVVGWADARLEQELNRITD